MNKIYKVVFNKSTGTFTAVTEFAKAQGKSSASTVGSTDIDSSRGFKLSAVVLAMLSLLSFQTAEAAYSVNGTVNNTHPDSIAIGSGTGVNLATANAARATAVGGGAVALSDATAVGKSATANGTMASAFGMGATASNTQSVAVGYYAIASGDQASAFGANAVASGSSSIAIGGDDLDSVSKFNLSGTSSATVNNGTLNTEFKKISGVDLVDMTTPGGGGNPGTQYLATRSSGQASIAVGTQAVSSGHLSTAFGTSASASGLAATALGVAAEASGQGAFAAAPGAKATGETSIALGASALANKIDTVAIGHSANATGNTSIAIGKNANATGNQSIAIGVGNQVSGNNAGAFGDPNTVSGNNSYAFGNDNTVNTENTFVLGNNVTTTVANSVVLGNKSAAVASGTSTKGTAAYASDTVVGLNLNFAGGTPTGVVSVGSATETRRIQGVSAGLISATSTDAINGSQLYAVADKLNKENYFHVNPNATTATATGTNNSAAVDGIGGATGGYALAAGFNAKADGNVSVAIGKDAQTDAHGAIAIGNGATAVVSGTTLSDGSVARRGIAIGSDSRSNHQDTIAMGTAASATNINAAAIGTGARATVEDATAIGAGSLASGPQSIALSKEAKATGEKSIALGYQAEAKSFGTALGSYSKTEDNYALAVGYEAQAIGQQSTAVGYKAEVTREGVAGVAVGQQASAQATHATAMGYQAVASGEKSTAIGDTARASAESAIAQGTEAQAIATNAIATGKSAFAVADNTIAQGTGAMAFKSDSIAQGTNALSVGDSAVAIGKNSYVGSADHTPDQIRKATDDYTTTEREITELEIKRTEKLNRYDELSAERSRLNRVRPRPLARINEIDAELQALDVELEEIEKKTITATETRDAAKTVLDAVEGAGVKGIAIGDDAKVYTENGVALGAGATVAKDATNAMALGAGASVTEGFENAVALGANSTTLTNATIENSATIGGMTYGDFAGDENITKGDQVSVGSAGNERQIKHVAPGNISASSTDAINGSQLYAVIDQTKTYFHVNNGTNAGTGDAATNLGKVTDAAGAAAKGAVTAGINATVAEAAPDAMALGTDAKVLNNSGNAIAVGNTAKVDRAAFAVAIGTNSTVSNSVNSVAIGRNANVTDGQSQIVMGTNATGSNSYVIAMGINANASGENALAIGNGTTSSSSSTVALGNKAAATASDAVAIGNSANASIAGSVALGKDSATSAAEATPSHDFNGITYNFAGTSPTSVVSVGSAGKERQVQNVAAGRVSASSTDAINGSQLHSVITESHWQLQANGTKVGDVNFGDKVDFKSTDKSVTITPTNEENGVSVLDFKVNTDNTTIKVDQTTGAVTANTTALSNADGKVNTPTNGGSLVNATTVADAINASGFKLTATQSTGEVVGTTEELINPSDLVTIDAGDNIKLTQANGKITVATKQDVTFNNVTANTTTTTNLTVKPSGNVDMGGNTVNNVAPAELSADSKQAVNGSQLFATNTNVTNNANNIATNTQNIATNTQNIANNAQNITNNAENIAKGINFGGTTGSNNYALGSTINVKGDSDITSETVAGGAQLSLSNTVKANLTSASTAVQSFTTAVNSTTVDTITKDNTVINFVDGVGTTATAKNGDITFDVNKADLTTDTAGNVTSNKAGDNFVTGNDVADAINKAAELTEKTTSVVKGSNTHVKSNVVGNNTEYTVSADKATVSVSGALTKTESTATDANGAVTTNYALDLSQTTKDEIKKGVDAKTTVDTKGLTFTGDNGTTTTEKLLGTSVAVNGDDNITTEASANAINIKLNKDITVDSVTANTTTTSNLTVKPGGSVDMGGNTVNNVAPAQLNATSTQAVNGSQLFATNNNVATNTQNIATNAENIAKGINFGGTTGSNNYALGSTINVKGDSDITSETVAGGAQLSLSNTVKANLTSASTAVQSFTTAVNGTTVDTINKTNTVVDFVDGTGTTAAIKENNITFNVNYDDSTLEIKDGKLNVKSTAIPKPKNYFHVNGTNENEIGNTTNLDDVDGVGGATGAYSLAAGFNATAVGNVSVALGTNATASNVSAIAIGDSARASAKEAIAQGTATHAVANSTIAIGTSTFALADNAIAQGSSALALSANAIAQGSSALALANNTIAQGTGAKAYFVDSVAQGTNAQAVGDSAVAIGKNSYVGSADYTPEQLKKITEDYVNAQREFTELETKRTEKINRYDVLTAEISRLTRTRPQPLARINELKAEVLALEDELEVIDNTHLIAEEKLTTTKETFDAVQGAGVKGIALGDEAKVYAENGVALGIGATVAKGFENAVALGSGSTTQANATIENSATIGGITYGDFAGGANITRGDQVSVGSAGNERQIKHVAPGNISASSTDAINGSQLYSVITESHWQLQANGTKVGDVNFGDKVNFNSTDKSVTITPTAEADGVSVLDFKVNTDNTTIKVDQTTGAVTANTTALADGNTDGKIDDPTNGGSLVNATTVANAINASGFKLTATQSTGEVVGTTEELINPSDLVTIDAGDNIKLTQANGKITVATKQDVTFNNVTANTTTTTNLTVKPNGNVDMGDNIVNNVTAAQLSADSKQAVNGSQLFATNNNVATNTQNIANNAQNITNNAENIAKGINFGGTTGSNNYALGDTINVKGDSDINSETVAGGAQLSLSDTVKANLTSASTAVQSFTTAVNSTTVDTITKDNTVINFVDGVGTTATAKNGDITFDVNKADLTTDTAGNVTSNKAGDNFVTGDDVADAINKAAELTEKTTSVVKGSNTHVKSNVVGNNTEYTVSADKSTVSVSGALTKTESTATDANGAVTTNYALDLSQTTKDDIKKGVDAKETVDNKGLTFTGDSGSTNVEKLGSTVAVNGDTNIATSAAGDAITIKLKDDITVNSVTANTVKAGDTTINNDGVTINNGTAGNPVTLTKDGLNNGGNKITNVADGEAPNDAVNVSQLEKAQKAAATEVVSYDESIKVTEEVGENGQTIYDLAVSVDDTTIETDGDGKLRVKTTELKPEANGKVAEPSTEDAPKLVNAGDIANAINNSGFNVKSGGNKAAGDDETSTLINPGEEVTFTAGDNLKVKRVGNEFSFETAKEVEFDKVTVGPVRLNKDSGIDAGNTSITNVKSNLAPVTAIDEKQPDANSLANLADKLNNAATVADVLNAGWNLQNNDTAIDTVTHNDAVNFINGRGTTVSVTANDDGTVNNIQVDSALGYVNTDANDTSTPSNTVKVFGKDNSPVQMTNVASGVRKADGTAPVGQELAEAIKNATGDTLNNAVNVGDLKAAVNTAIAASQEDVVSTDGSISVQRDVNPVTKATTFDVSVNVDNTTITKDKDGQLTANTVNLTNDENGKVNAPTVGGQDAGKSLVTAQTVVDAINNSGFTLTTGQQESGLTASPDTKELINPGKEVKMIAGDNLVVAQEGGNIAYSLRPNINIESVQFNNGPKITNDGNNITVSKADGSATKITNVADGDVNADSKDAVNGSQLHTAITNINNNITESTQTYFHTNNGTNIGGDATTNLGGVNQSAGATALGSLAAGIRAKATGENGVAVGSDSLSSLSSVAVGNKSKAEGRESVAIGLESSSSAWRTTAIGYQAEATVESANALGNQAKATNWGATAVGTIANASGINSSAFGNNASSSGSLSLAVGTTANATGSYATAVGTLSNAKAYGAIGTGLHSYASGQNAIATGSYSVADGIASIATGWEAVATGRLTTAVGYNAKADNNQAIAVGTNSVSPSSYAISIGSNTGGLAHGAVALGRDAIAGGDAELKQKATAYFDKLDAYTAKERILATTSPTASSYNRHKTEAEALKAELDVLKAEYDAAVEAAFTKGEYATALGAYAQAEHKDSVALGSYSTTAEAVNTNNATVNGISYSGFAGNVATATVSVGKEGTYRTITNVAAGRISATSTDAINGSQLYAVANAIPATYTTTTGAPLVKVGDKFYKPADIPADGSAPDENKAVNPADVMVSLISPNASQTANAATTLANVKSNLAPVTPIDEKQPNANSAANLADKLNNAATVADVLNAGWNLQNNDTAIDTVTHNDAVNFINGRGTTVSVTANDDGTVNNIQVDSALGYVNTDANDTSTPSNTVKVFGKDNSPVQMTNVASGVRKADGTAPVGQELAEAIKNATGDTLNNAVNVGDLKAAVNAAIATSQEDVVSTDGSISVRRDVNPVTKATTFDVSVNVDNTTITKDKDGQLTANTVNLTNDENGKVNAPTVGGQDAGKSLVTAQTVVDAINNSGWNLAADGTTGKELINPSDTVTFKAGDNLNVKREGANITYALNENITVTSVKAGDTTINNDGLTITGGPSVTKTGINAGNKKITGVVAGEADTDAVNVSQLKKAISTSGFNLKTSATADGKKVTGTADNGELISPSDSVEMIAGKNLTVKQDADGKVTYATQEDVQFNSVQFGNATNAGPKITHDGNNIKVGDKDGNATKITNVADGDISPVSKDAINGGQLNNYAKVNGKNVNVANGSINIVDGSGTAVTTNQAGEIKVDVKTENSDTITLGVNPETGNIQAKAVTAPLTMETATASNGTPVTTGRVAVPANQNALATAADVANAVNNSGFDLAVGADSDSNGKASVDNQAVTNNDNGARVNPSNKVSINAGRNIEVRRSGRDVTIATSENPEFNSVKTGDTTVSNDGITINNGAEGNSVSLTKNGLDNGGNRITNVKDGEANSDAVNVGQLKGVANQISNKINRNNREARAGIAGSNAAASLPQVYIPGKSMVAAAAGTFKGENALAVGYSRASDNGKLILKLQGNANSRGDVGAGVGIGYQW